MFVLVALGAFTLGAVTRAQDSPPDPAMRCGEIHEAVAAAGLKCLSVRLTHGRYEVLLDPSCAGEQARADQIRDQILSRPPKILVVDNLQDALVVLRFDARNESANRLVRERYLQLKAAAKPQ